MKYLLALLAIPAAAFSQVVGPVRGLPDCPGVSIASTGKCARAAEGRLGARFVVRVHPSLLTITLLNGITKEFRDSAFDTNKEIASGASYSAIAITSDARYVTLHRQTYEGEASSILDRQTGAEIKLDGYPIFSPDERRVATIGMDLAAEFSPNVLRIYRVTSEGLTLEYDARPNKWGPVDAMWTSPVALQYVHATSECYTEHYMVPKGCIQETLRYDGAGWR